VRTCAICDHQTIDEMKNCPNCGADLSADSVRAHSLARMRNNERVSHITVIVDDTACPTCQAVQATYEKQAVPELPVAGCSCAEGCTCTYLPVLSEIFP